MCSVLNLNDNLAIDVTVKQTDHYVVVTPVGGSEPEKQTFQFLNAGKNILAVFLTQFLV